VARTYLDLQNEALGNDFDPATYRARAKQWLSEAVHRVARRARVRTWRASYAFPIVAGSASYLLPSDFVRLQTIRNTADAADLVEVDVDDIDNMPTSSGRPTAFVQDAMSVVFYPTPDRVYTEHAALHEDGVAARGRWRHARRARDRGHVRRHAGAHELRAGRKAVRSARTTLRASDFRGSASFDAGRFPVRRGRSRCAAAVVTKADFHGGINFEAAPYALAGRGGARPAQRRVDRARRDPQARRDPDAGDVRDDADEPVRGAQPELPDRAGGTVLYSITPDGTVATIKTGMANGARWEWVQAPIVGARARSTG
jgi:hypothetical protein